MTGIDNLLGELDKVDSKKAERIRKLEEQKKQIAARISAEKNAEAKQKRKDDTRRKIVLGGIMEKWIRDGLISGDSLDQLKTEIHLLPERDQVLFGVEAKPKATTDTEKE